MGSELVGDSTSLNDGSSENATPFSNIFEKQCPFYMSIGMTYNEYWNEDCMLTKYYLEAYKQKQERKNQELWLQGFYIYSALCDVSPVLHAFAKSGVKPLPYMTKPIPLTAEEREQREIEERNERLKALKEQLLYSVEVKRNG